MTIDLVSIVEYAEYKCTYLIMKIWNDDNNDDDKNVNKEKPDPLHCRNSVSSCVLSK